MQSLTTECVRCLTDNLWRFPYQFFLDWNSLPGLRLWSVAFERLDLPPPWVPVELVPASQANLTILPSFHVPLLLKDVPEVNGRQRNERVQITNRIKAKWARESSRRRNQEIA
jgi:hypothetical protein